jgi:hypothetical protein
MVASKKPSPSRQSYWSEAVKRKNRRWEKNSCAYNAFMASNNLSQIASDFLESDLGLAADLPPVVLESYKDNIFWAKRKVFDMDLECGLFLDDIEKGAGKVSGSQWKALDDAFEAGNWYRVGTMAEEIRDDIRKQMEAIMETSPPSYEELMPGLENEITDLWLKKYPNKA